MPYLVTSVPLVLLAEETSIVAIYAWAKVCAFVVLGGSNRDPARIVGEREPVMKFLRNLWSEESGQDIAEYAVMLAVILVIVVGTIRLIGSNANTVFSQVGSAIQ